jgi:hypothetical protein
MISRRGSPALKGSAIDQHRMRAAALSWTAAQLFGLSLVGHPGRSLRAFVLSTVGRVVAAKVDPIRYADRLAFCRGLGLGLGGQWATAYGSRKRPWHRPRPCETSIVFATVLTAVFLKERFGWTRHVAATVVALAAAVLRLA